MSRFPRTITTRPVHPAEPPFAAADRTTASRVSARPRLRSVLAVTAACGGTGLLVAACSAAATATREASPAYHNAGVPAAAPVAGSATFNTAKTAGQGGSGTVVTGLVRLAPDQSIIYTAYVTLRVKDVTAAATTATTDVTTAGGYVASEHQFAPAGQHGAGQVTLELKIPVAGYHATLTDLTALGHQLAFSTQAQDVTQQVADVASRVASAQAAIKQLRALLTRAGSVGGLLSVQDEINSQESSLEALLAQQQALAHETSYGTVTLVLRGHHVAVVHKRKKTHRGLVAGLLTGWRALKLVVVWLLTALGTILPFAVPVILIGGIAVVGRRRLRRRTPPAAAPPAATS
jgi:Domain of unknown function (DUF4349)